MHDGAGRRARPLSPHLTVFRPIITMMMSIMHRITGAALYIGMVFYVAWLVALAGGERFYERAQWFFASPLGVVILIGLGFSLIHHTLGGIRHLIWDMGYGLEKRTSTRLAWATIIGSIVLTLAVVVIGVLMASGAYGCSIQKEAWWN